MLRNDIWLSHNFSQIHKQYTAVRHCLRQYTPSLRVPRLHHYCVCHIVRCYLYKGINANKVLGASNASCILVI